MKKLTILGLIVGCGIIFSCDKLKDLASADFDLNHADVTVTIPAQPTPGTTTIPGSNIYINLDSIIKSKSSSLSISNLKSAYLKSCVIKIASSSAGQDFSPVESCSLTFNNVGSSSADVEVANLPSNPDVVATSLTIPVNTTKELSSFFKAGNNFKYTVIIKTRKAVTNVTDCRVSLTYSIKAGL